MLFKNGFAIWKGLPSSSSVLGALGTCVGLVVWAVHSLRALSGTVQAIQMSAVVDLEGDTSEKIRSIAESSVATFSIVVGMLAVLIVILSAWVNRFVRDRLEGKVSRVTFTRSGSQHAMQITTFILLIVTAVLWLVDTGWFVAAVVAKHSAMAASNGSVDLLSFVDEQLELNRENIMQSVENIVEENENLQHMQEQLGPELLTAYQAAFQEMVGNVTIRNQTVSEWNSTLNDITSVIDNVTKNLFDALIGNGIQLLGQAFLLCAVTGHCAQLLYLQQEKKSHILQNVSEKPEVLVIPYGEEMQT